MRATFSIFYLTASPPLPNYSQLLISYLISIIRPTTEFHFTMLIIKWEPRDVYLACALEDTRRDVQTTAVMLDHNICVVRAIESLIRTVFLIKICKIILFCLTVDLFVSSSSSFFFDVRIVYQKYIINWTTRR